MRDDHLPHFLLYGTILPISSKNYPDQAPAATPRLLGVVESARYLGLRPATLRKWVFERRIETVRIGRRVLIRTETLEQLVRDGTRPAL